MKAYVLSAAVNLAVDNYLKNLRRAFPSTPWAGVEHYARRAWFAADEPEIPWDRVESRIMDGWNEDANLVPVLEPAMAGSDLAGRVRKSHRYTGRCGPARTKQAETPSPYAPVTGAEYEQWSVARRSLQERTKSGLEGYRDPLLDFGSQG